MKMLIIIISALSFPIIFFGCGQETVVFEQTLDVETGRPFHYQIQPGTYRMEMTSSGEGVTIEFAGTKREKTGRSKQFGGTITYSQPGEIILSNTSAPLGNLSKATITITKTK